MAVTAVARDMREVILDAVERLLARYGYRRMTMDDIAQEASIARRTIYLHFSGKEEVALASIDRVVERLLERLRCVASEDATPEERLRRMLITRVMFRFESVQEYHHSFNEMFAALRSAYMARRERYFEAEAAVFAEVLQEGERTGDFALENVLATARILLTATNALLPYSLSPRELGSREDVEDKITRIAALLSRGLRSV